jgi:uncharacterized protein (TIGR02594 family)
MVTTSALEVAKTFAGVKEISGALNNPQIQAFLATDFQPGQPAVADEIAWCSAFVNYVAKLLNLERSKSLAARSWLRVGAVIDLSQAQADCDVVILKRGGGMQPGPEVIQAPGHVGFYAGRDASGNVLVWGGNQHDEVCLQSFSPINILGVRRLRRA